MGMAGTNGTSTPIALRTSRSGCCGKPLLKSQACRHRFHMPDLDTRELMDGTWQIRRKPLDKWLWACRPGLSARFLVFLKNHFGEAALSVDPLGIF